MLKEEGAVTLAILYMLLHCLDSFICNNFIIAILNPQISCCSGKKRKKLSLSSEKSEFKIRTYHLTCPFFFKDLFICLFLEMQREREAETQAEGEAGSMQRA